VTLGLTLKNARRTTVGAALKQMSEMSARVQSRMASAMVRGARPDIGPRDFSCFSREDSRFGLLITRNIFLI
jgi:hypothetical protein